MRTILVNEVREAVKELSIISNLTLPEDVKAAIHAAFERETDPIACRMLDMILKNHDIACEEHLPLCQDTGTAVVFLQIGQDVHLEGGSLQEAVNKGVAEGYSQGYLRKSMVSHPWKRTNTGDNTPALIHTEIVPGDQLSIQMIPKGGGAENYASLSMLSPAQGIAAAKEFVLDCVRRAGPNACPPLVVGVGIGGNAECAPLLAKKALLRSLDERNPDPETAKLEEELLERINALGIGPMGLGGKTTALAVAIETSPCHIASFPVAVNLNCHVHRHASRIL